MESFMRRSVIILSILSFGCAKKDDDERQLSPYLDSDQDGFPETEDCNDKDPSIHPDALEMCDEGMVDENCNGEANEDSAFDAPLWFEDKDGDTFGDALVTAPGCTAPLGYVGLQTDCDDSDSSSFPGAVEMCDTVDNDCDGTIDEGTAFDATTWYKDVDADGYGSFFDTMRACEQPESYVCVSAKDTVPASVCSDWCDNDMDGLTDAEDPDCSDTLGNGKSWETLAGEDTFNWADYTGELWEDKEVRYWDYNGDEGWNQVGDTSTAGMDFDCNDNEPVINPGMEEQCDDNDIDENCDILIDDEDEDALGQVRWNADMDNDSFGDPAVSYEACDQPEGMVDNEGDCDDAVALVNPDNAEICGDGIDNDCDGEVDEDDAPFPLQWYRDADGDGYGDASSPWPVELCGEPDDTSTSWVTDATDCDDTPAVGEDPRGSVIHPGATEVWYDDVDEDCDSNLDDADGDGYPGHSDPLLAEDCDDGEPLSNPGSPEICGDGLDNNCDGIEEECVVVDAIVGLGAYDRTGASVSLGGDVNGDGNDDALVGASRHDADGLSRGAAYLMAGDVTGETSADTALATYIGEADHDRAGSSVAIVGDTNGDGFDDFVVGAFAEDAGGSEAGAAYLILGPASGSMSLSDADAKFIGEVGDDHAGLVVAAAGDTDGDGNADFYVGAPGYDGGAAEVGATYLVRGPISADEDLSFADVRYIGTENGEGAGSSVANVGDFDGDGMDDALIGAPNATEGGSYVGAAYVVLNQVSDDFTGTPFTGTITLDEADVRWHGINGGDQAGYSVSPAGDQNDDGLADILIGAPGNDSGGAGSGAAFIVYGGTSFLCGDGELCPSLPLADADAKLIGERGDDFAGGAVDGGGDINGDEIPDVAIGSRTEDATDSDAGAAYVMFGPLSGTTDLSESMAKVLGAGAGDWTGAALSMSGDLNNDGYSDLLVGAPQLDAGGDFPDLGAVWILKGGW
jgi:hypothetical protein